MNEGRLTAMLDTFGPCGGEDLTRGFIEDEIKGFVDELSTDVLGNLIARKRGGSKRLMFTAAMDGVTMIVTFIDEKGFIRFTAVGGFPPDALVGRQVIFRNGTIGIIGCDGMAAAALPQISDLFIDTGACGGISPGEACVLYNQCVIDGTKLITCVPKRLGCFIMTEAIERINESPYDLYFVFTAQRAIGYAGVKAAAYTVAPDYCISLGTATAYDTPNARALPVRLGGGAAIKLKDADIPAHPSVYRYLEERASTGGIKYQHEISEHGTSALRHVYLSGVPCGGISVPVRYTPPAALCFKSDISDCIELTHSAATGLLA